MTKKQLKCLDLIGKILKNSKFSQTNPWKLHGSRFFFFSKNQPNDVVSGTITSWRYFKKKLYLDTTVPSINYIVIESGSVSVKAVSGNVYEGCLEILE